MKKNLGRTLYTDFRLLVTYYIARHHIVVGVSWALLSWPPPLLPVRHMAQGLRGRV